MSRRRWTKRARELRRAGDLLEAVLSRHGVAREVRAHRLVTEWRAIVGPRIASRAWPEGISEGVLWVRVVNSAWLQELSFLRDDLLERVQDVVQGEPAIADIKFRLRPHTAGPGDRPSIPRPPPRAQLLPRRDPATGERLDAIRDEVESVEDPDLREIIFQTRRRLDL